MLVQIYDDLAINPDKVVAVREERSVQGAVCIVTLEQGRYYVPAPATVSEVLNRLEGR